MKQWKKDVILACVLLAFSIVSIVYSIGLKDRRMEYFLARADTYVILWTFFLAVLSIILLIRSLKNRPETVGKPILSRQFLSSAGIIIVYVLLLDYLGFVISSTLFVLALLIYFTCEEKHGEIPRGKGLARQIVIWILITGITVFATKYLFGNMLGLSLPQGIFYR